MAINHAAVAEVQSSQCTHRKEVETPRWAGDVAEPDNKPKVWWSAWFRQISHFTDEDGAGHFSSFHQEQDFTVTCAAAGSVPRASLFLCLPLCQMLENAEIGPICFSPLVADTNKVAFCHNYTVIFTINEQFLTRAAASSCMSVT